MASRQETVDFIIDQTVNAGLVTAKKMFGEYAIYHDTKVVALVCDDDLFIKVLSQKVGEFDRFTFSFVNYG